MKTKPLFPFGLAHEREVVRKQRPPPHRRKTIIRSWGKCRLHLLIAGQFGCQHLRDRLALPPNLGSPKVDTRPKNPNRLWMVFACLWGAAVVFVAWQAFSAG